MLSVFDGVRDLEILSIYTLDPPSLLLPVVEVKKV